MLRAHFAPTFIPEEIDKLMERVWQAGNDIRWSQVTCAAIPPNHTERFYQEVFNDGFGSVPKKRVAELRIEARRLLRPLAQLANDEPSRLQKAKELDETKAKQMGADLLRRRKPDRFREVGFGAAVRIDRQRVASTA